MSKLTHRPTNKIHKTPRVNKFIPIYGDLHKHHHSEDENILLHIWTISAARQQFIFLSSRVKHSKVSKPTRHGLRSSSNAKFFVFTWIGLVIS